MKFNKILLTGLFAALVGVGLATPRATLAESSSCTASPCGTSASVDFRVVIPVFLHLQIGTGSLGTTNPTQDLITFDYTANSIDIGTGNPPGSTTGGDVGGGVVTAEVFGNGGDVTLNTLLTLGGSGLTDGTNFIAWDEIDTALSAGTMTPPVLQNAPVAPVVYVANPGGVVNLRNSTWTYTYANTTTPGAGNYDGTATYTASLP